MKKIFCAILAAALLLGLAGCGASGGTVAASYANNGNAPMAGAGRNPSTPGEAMQNSLWDGILMTTDEFDGAMPDESWRYVEQDPEEEYDNSPETPFKVVASSPLSTFSSDVDTASYSNMRRQLGWGSVPEGVRIEELVNYFDYDYPRPRRNAEHPFTVTTEIAPCPWNQSHQLAMVGIQGASLEHSGDMANNIVFLIDVSGSMYDDNKLPLLKESFKLMLEKLGENDTISIVTYAGSDKVIADGVNGARHTKLTRLIDDLSAGGSTAGAQGLATAYSLANKHFIEGGNNRIILATDGDFNVGPSSTEAMQEMVELERENGIFISVLGYGMYNLKDNMMETIADYGNGNYAYIDTMDEARKVLVDEFDSTMFVIAKDLKIQVEFNPDVVAQYRLVGYNNRRLENEDFNDDRKDAGDVGAGHSVTAFYELVLVGDEGPASTDDLKYQTAQPTGSSEYMTVKVRYKEPDGDTSKLAEYPVLPSHYSENMSEDFAFASAVAEFGLILTDSDYRAQSNTRSVKERASGSLGRDPYSLRAEFVLLVETYEEIAD